MKKNLMFVAAILLPLQAFAWGAIGHRAVGTIAHNNLSNEAKLAVSKLIGRGTLGDVAVWADNIRGSEDYRQAGKYHFEKVADGVNFLTHFRTLSELERKKGGTVSALLMANEGLRGDKSLGETTDILKFLVHFVGDIHQPFHSGRPEDKGANDIRLNWFGQETSLHHVWDTAIIETGHPDLMKGSRDAYAEYLTRKFNDRSFKLDMDVEGWLNESMQLRVGAYETTYRTDQARYQRIHLEEVDRRIYMAGLRLASLLNSIYGNQPTPASQIQLRRNMEAIAGDLHSFISFKKNGSLSSESDGEL